MNPEVVLQLKQLCEDCNLNSVVDLLSIVIALLRNSDTLFENKQETKDLIFDTIVDICDGADDTFGTDDDVYNIEDKLDEIRGVVNMVVDLAFETISREDEIKAAVAAVEEATKPVWNHLRKLFKWTQ